MNDAYKVGDHVRWCKGHGDVIAVIEREELLDADTALRWRPLGRGIVVRSHEGELFHFRDAMPALRHVR